MYSFKKFGLIFGMLALLFLAVGLLAGAPVAVSAADRGSANDAGSGPAALVWAQTSPADDGLPDISNAACLTCHAQSGMQTTLPSGEILYLTVNPEVYGSSVHGAQTQACTACHTDIDGFPHPELTVQTLREYQIEMAQACAACHQDYVDKTADSVHALALEAGNQNAAVCTDCHGAHNVKTPGEPRSSIPQMCQRCHSEIFLQYKESVHGEALIDEGNPDVPSCINCHGVHNVQGASVNDEFKLYSPLICAECHADEELMNKYGVNTNVFDSYISDFHGSTTLIFSQTAEGQSFNTPVCIDCHGVHDIAASDDPEKSLAVKENLLIKCQRCHPDASTNFSDAWLGHYEPSATKYPLVYFVDLFYKLFIPTVLGIMVILVGADFGAKISGYLKERKNEQH